VSVRHHRDLEVWRLADDIRRKMVQITARSNVRRDFGFCDQTDRAASSACRNIAEGFYRFSHPEFAHFLKIARGSLGELLDSLDEARQKGYMTEQEAVTIEASIARAMAKILALHKHLTSNPTPST
jgi:four helix bundle protein